MVGGSGSKFKLMSLTKLSPGAYCANNSSIGPASLGCWGSSACALIALFFCFDSFVFVFSVDSFELPLVAGLL